MRFKNKNHKKHYELWIKKSLNHAHPRHCYMCDENIERNYGRRGCMYCPGDWPFDDEGEPNCEHKNSLYTAWINEIDPEKKSKIAIQIANMEWLDR